MLKNYDHNSVHSYPTPVKLAYFGPILNLVIENLYQLLSARKIHLGLYDFNEMLRLVYLNSKNCISKGNMQIKRLDHSIITTGVLPFFLIFALLEKSDFRVIFEVT